MRGEIRLQPFSHLVNLLQHAIPQLVVLAENVLDAVGATVRRMLIEASLAQEHIALHTVELGLFDDAFVAWLLDEALPANLHRRLFQTVILARQHDERVLFLTILVAAVVFL